MSNPERMCPCVVKLLFPNAAREQQVMFLPFFCQKVRRKIKAQQPFSSDRATVEARLSFQVQCGGKRKSCANIKAQNQVRPTHGAIPNIVLKSASNKYLKATLRVGAEFEITGFATLHRSPCISGLFRRAL
jgi:hypothetical protein